MSKTKNKNKKRKFWLVMLYLLSFISSVLPLLLVFMKNFDRYVSSAEDAIKLSFGVILVLVVILLKVIGKLKIPGRLVCSTICLMMCWLFATMLSDLLLISGAWWISEVVDFVIFSPLIKHTKKKIEIAETAAASAAATAEAIEAYLGRV